MFSFLPETLAKTVCTEPETLKAPFSCASTLLCDFYLHKLFSSVFQTAVLPQTCRPSGKAIHIKDSVKTEITGSQGTQSHFQLQDF